ncbi:PREDICTED: uncharacterized protein LOC109239227 [Nicotiana attenuata]|uniref:uncharacterized protein LOC109239227 n=1 Tax=Nicotiana attenuata TaxID=49451 RepID=UPI0009048FDC|nr:PREDICTED: uncharacterized protein LOC109239227 [Nicotiana attenuata]
MTDIRLMSYYLGLEVKQMEDGIFISQEIYTKEILKKFNMLDCNPVNTPMESGTKFSKFDEGEKVDPTFFKKSCGKFEVLDFDFNLMGFCDSDYAGDIDVRKSTTSFVLFSGDYVISCSSKKQSIITLSACEAEYVAATSCTCHAIWLRRLLKGLNLQKIEASEIFIDNKSAQVLVKNSVYHDRRKHIDNVSLYQRMHCQEGSRAQICESS